MSGQLEQIIGYLERDGVTEVVISVGRPIAMKQRDAFVNLTARPLSPDQVMAILRGTPIAAMVPAADGMAEPADVDIGNRRARVQVGRRGQEIVVRFERPAPRPDRKIRAQTAADEPFGQPRAPAEGHMAAAVETRARPPGVRAPDFEPFRSSAGKAPEPDAFRSAAKAPEPEPRAKTPTGGPKFIPTPRAKSPTASTLSNEPRTKSPTAQPRTKTPSSPPRTKSASKAPRTKGNTNAPRTKGNTNAPRTKQPTRPPGKSLDLDLGTLQGTRAQFVAPATTLDVDLGSIGSTKPVPLDEHGGRKPISLDELDMDFGAGSLELDPADVRAGDARPTWDAAVQVPASRDTPVPIAAKRAVEAASSAPVLGVSSQPVLGDGPLAQAAAESMLLPLLDGALRAQLERLGYADLAVPIAAGGRLRANITRHQAGLKGTFRLAVPEPPTLDQLGLPKDLAKVVAHHQGLVVIAGPSGHGKTTTLSALVDLVNASKPHHILTVEDPIEIVYPRKAAVVSQREAGRHTRSFASALKASLREDPDVIVIGELRDRETVEIALTASETGHLVLATMSTPSAAKTIDRLIDMFPPDEHTQVRASIAGALRAIVAQRLLPARDGKVAAAVELVTGVLPLAVLIRDDKLYQLPNLMQRGKAFGMIRFDDSLLELFRAGKISEDTALANAGNRAELSAALKRPS